MIPRRRNNLPPSPNLEAFHIPAPTGGLNTISAGSALPVTDCIQGVNLIASEFGLRSRLGYQQWDSGLTGTGNNNVRTLLPFQGSVASKNRLFAATSSGIYNITTSGWNLWVASTAYAVGTRVLNGSNIYICTTSGTSAGSGGPIGTGTGIADGSCVWSFVEVSFIVDFPNKYGDAGYGISTVFVNSAGHFLVYCDEINGLYIYTESSSTWAKISFGVTQAWASGTAYLIGDQVTNGGNIYLCDTNGTSASSGGPTGTGANIVDGTTRWDYVSAASSTSIGPSLSDSRAGLTLDPNNFVYVTAFKQRLWFVERDTARAWYLGLNSLYGTATSFQMGTRFRQGGALVGLWNWTLDGGAGIDDLLVAISQGGDIAIYQGTDPSSASTFGLKGVWYVGAIPAGRRIANNYGGDVLILSKLGLVSLSTLIAARGQISNSEYATAKISNLFNNYMVQCSTAQGWSIHIHPEDNALLVTVPINGQGQPSIQLVMSFATKGWYEYRELPILCAGVFNGYLYFGTNDGKININTGYIDVTTPIQWRLMTGFQNLGNARMKQVQSIRPIILCEGGVAGYKAEARYRYDFTDITSQSVGTGVGWDTSLWDGGVWGGTFVANQNITGAVGMGVDVAVAIRGAANTKTILVGFDVLFNQGGYL